MAYQLLANPTQPRQLVAAEVGLYLWVGWELVHSLPFAADRFGAWVVVLVVLRALASYAMANESKIGWWLALGLCPVSLWPVWEDLVADPASIVRPDVLTLVAFPVVIAVLLLQPASRTYVRVWFG
jgi:hypothetical protein